MGIMADFLRWEAKVMKAIPDTLITDVKQVVEEDFVEVADSAVYSTYSPKYYADGSVFGRQRRFSGGGIQDVGLIESNLAGNLTLVMKQTSPPNSNDPQMSTAIDWVESGKGVPGARPFYAPLKAVAIPHAHQALVAGLHKRGL